MYRQKEKILIDLKLPANEKKFGFNLVGCENHGIKYHLKDAKKDLVSLNIDPNRLTKKGNDIIFDKVVIGSNYVKSGILLCSQEKGRKFRRVMRDNAINLIISDVIHYVPVNTNYIRDNEKKYSVNVQYCYEGQRREEYGNKWNLLTIEEIKYLWDRGMSLLYKIDDKEYVLYHSFMNKFRQKLIISRESKPPKMVTRIIF